jgi:hypothetical protein
VTDAANSLTIARAYAPTAAKLQIAIAAPATAEQQAADKKPHSSPTIIRL